MDKRDLRVYVVIAGVAGIMVVTLMAMVLGITTIAMVSNTLHTATGTVFNATACAQNSLPANCGIPAGMICTVLNSTSPGLVCLDYWVSPNGSQVYISNVSNIQNVVVSNHLS